MKKNYFNNHFLILYIYPFILGGLTVLSFQPFNLTFINFIIFPLFFYLIFYIEKKSKSIYRKRPYKTNFFIAGQSFGFGFYLLGISWIANSLTFDENFKILIPFAIILFLFFRFIYFFTGIIYRPKIKIRFHVYTYFFWKFCFL